MVQPVDRDLAVDGDRLRAASPDSEAGRALAAARIGSTAPSGGDIPVLASDARTGEEPDEVLDHVDGLILAGGADLDPASYGAEPHHCTTGTRPERDAAELPLARRAVERDLPVLGVGSVATLIALPFAVEEYVPGVLPAALSLVVGGLALVVIAILTARRRRDTPAA